MTPSTPAELLDLAVRTAHEAGAELLRRYGRVEGLSTKSSGTDPVSEADRASERLIVAALLAARPDDGVVGEEGAERASGSGLTWVIDPLDGTVNYLYERDEFAVSIAGEDADGALVGVVHDPVRDRTWTAVRGAGAARTGARGTTRLRVSEPDGLAGALLGTGFGYDAGRRRRQGSVVAALLPHVRDIRRAGSAALDLCAVASGRLDAYYEEGVQRWDVAAGALIAAESGAWVTSPPPLTGSGSAWLVCAPAVREELLALLAAQR